jgi:hypothetical protein
MPTECFLLSHIACATQLFAVGVAQFIVGMIVLDLDNVRGSGGHECGAITVGAAVFAIVAGVCSVNVWRLFQPRADITGKVKPVAPEISKVEQTYASDPRRHSLAACLLALPLCISAAVIDGSECVAPLTALDECTETAFNQYLGCSVTGPGGDPAAACACVSHSTASEGWSCTFLMKEVPDFLAIGGTSGCDHMPHQLITWLQISTVLSGVAALLLAVVLGLGFLNALSSPSCFRAVVLARHEESSFDHADDFSLEFHNRARTSSTSSSANRGKRPDADLF